MYEAQSNKINAVGGGGVKVIIYKNLIERSVCG